MLDICYASLLLTWFKGTFINENINNAQIKHFVLFESFSLKLLNNNKMYNNLSKFGQH